MFCWLEYWVNITLVFNWFFVCPTTSLSLFSSLIMFCNWSAEFANSRISSANLKFERYSPSTSLPYFFSFQFSFLKISSKQAVKRLGSLVFPCLTYFCQHNFREFKVFTVYQIQISFKVWPDDCARSQGYGFCWFASVFCQKKNDRI